MTHTELWNVVRKTPYDTLLHINNEHVYATNYRMNTAWYRHLHLYKTLNYTHRLQVFEGHIYTSSMKPVVFHFIVKWKLKFAEPLPPTAPRAVNSVCG